MYKLSQMDYFKKIMTKCRREYVGGESKKKV